MKDILGYKDEFLSKSKLYNLWRLTSPLPCMLCGDDGAVDEGPFCPECYKEFEELLHTSCPVCGASKEKCLCHNLVGIDKIFFLFWYNDDLSKKIISKIKYKGEKRYITYFGKLISEHIKSEYAGADFDCICFTPRSKKNMTRIGFDQSEYLSKAASFYLDLPVVRCIGRKGKNEEQKRLSGSARRKNVKNKFQLNKELLLDDNGKTPKVVLLIDDVVTTGSTVQQCAYLLKKAGVRKVYVGVVAKTPSKKTITGRYVRK